MCCPQDLLEQLWLHQIYDFDSNGVMRSVDVHFFLLAWYIGTKKISRQVQQHGERTKKTALPHRTFASCGASNHPNGPALPQKTKSWRH